jgi:hypothetical protein
MRKKKGKGKRDVESGRKCGTLDWPWGIILWQEILFEHAADEGYEVGHFAGERKRTTIGDLSDGLACAP